LGENAAMKKYVLETVVFVCGAVVMILELVGSRLIAPYMGTSIIVWTSLIGIILASLSVGYWWGGALSDKNPNTKTFSRIILAAALFIFIMNLGKAHLLSFLQGQISDIRVGAVVAAVLLFAIPSTLLGMVSPYAVRLKMRDVSTSGSTVGKLYAISTIGSIVGTFSAGFFLISYFGSTHIIFLLSAILLLASILAQGRSGLKIRLFLLLLVFVLPQIPALAALQNPDDRKNFVDVDTIYNRVWIFDAVDTKSRRSLRFLSTDPKSTQSIAFLDGPGLFSKYLEFFDIAGVIKTDIKTALMLGGGAYIYPQYFLDSFPQAQVDVFEIDPALILLAKKYFGLKDNPRLAVYHEDGRLFLNKAQKKYDVIFSDVYKANDSIPFQLTTREAVQGISNILKDDGVVVVNIASNLPPRQSDFVLAEYKTFKEIFSQVYLFKVDPEKKIDEGHQNIVLVAVKYADPVLSNPDHFALSGYLEHLFPGPLETNLPLLTDEFAPVDRYTAYGR
jgi:spermidine synthase